MKAEKTRELMYMNPISWEIIKDEITELERLAKLGQAVQKVFEKGNDVNIYRENDNGYSEIIKVIESAEDLLEWAEQEEEK